MAAGNTYTPIATTTLGSAASSYTFSSIPGTYTDLVLVVSGKYSTGTTGTTTVQIQVGNTSLDTGANYSIVYLNGSGSAATSGVVGGTTSSGIGELENNSGNPGTVIAQYCNYANTTTYKTMLARANTSGSWVQVMVNLWRSTAAINTIKVFSTATFGIGTTFTLYGILAA